MEELRLGTVESRFADIIWAHELPTFSGLGDTLPGTAQLEEANHLYRAAEALRTGDLSERERHGKL